MEISRRGMLRRLLGTAGVVSLATGVPASFLRIAGCRRADAAFSPPEYRYAPTSRAQFLVLVMSRHGHPINANAPGSYEDPAIIHPNADAAKGTSFRLGDANVTGAQAWSTLPEALRAKTCFFHGSTGTLLHTDTAKVAALMGATEGNQLMASIYAAALAPSLETVLTTPLSLLTNDHPDEAAIFAGRSIPNVDALAIRDAILAERGTLETLRRLRDLSMDRLHAKLKASGTAEEKAFVDGVAQSAREARDLGEELLGGLRDCTTPDADTQVLVAAALVKMKVSPVVIINIPFGGDNHIDRALADESTQLASGVRRTGALMDRLGALGMQDHTTFMTFNPFGRTLVLNGTNGRNHVDHHVSVVIGNAIRGGVVGGVGRDASTGDYAALEIDARTGRGVQSGGDVPRSDALASLAKTVGVGLGIEQATLDKAITRGKVVPAALVG